jgi:hypothetical protein
LLQPDRLERGPGMRTVHAIEEVVVEAEVLACFREQRHN